MLPITNILTGQIILGCWVVFLVFWFVASFSAKPVAERQPFTGRQILLRLLAGLGVIFLFSGTFSSITDIAFWSYSTTIGIVADVMALCGLFLMLWARVTLGGNWSASVVLKQQHELIQSGPYALVRHPIYSGLLLMILGEAVWYGTLRWLLLLIAFLIGMSLKAQREERLMTKHFPEAYPAYKSRTKALIPFVL